MSYNVLQFGATMDELLCIDRLEWDEWNLDHIQKHGLGQDDGEYLIELTPTAQRTYKGRWLLLEPNADDRIIAVVIGAVPDKPNSFYPFSARIASRKERELYTMGKLGRKLVATMSNKFLKKVPEFKNIQEEAEFWDTHDFTDYAGFSTPVKIEVSPNLTSILTIRIEGDDFDQLTKRARELGIGASTLARMWIRERLRQEASHAAE